MIDEAVEEWVRSNLDELGRWGATSRPDDRQPVADGSEVPLGPTSAPGPDDRRSQRRGVLVALVAVAAALVLVAGSYLSNRSQGTADVAMVDSRSSTSVPGPSGTTPTEQALQCRSSSPVAFGVDFVAPIATEEAAADAGKAEAAAFRPVDNWMFVEDEGSTQVWAGVLAGEIQVVFDVVAVEGGWLPTAIRFC
jgi:hypothetical protein